MSEPLPSPPGVPVLGHTHRYVRDTFDFTDHAFETVGDAYRIDVLGVGELCLLGHPDHVEQVLVDERDAFRKSAGFDVAFGDGLASVEGARWERQRDALEEFFYPERIRSYAEEMVEVTDRRLDRWEPGETVSLVEQMKAVTVENLFATLFDRRINPGEDQDLRRAIVDLNKWFEPTSYALPRWVPTPARRRYRAAMETVRTEAQRLLDEREQAVRAGEAAAGDDLLSTLVAHRQQGDEGLSDDEIVDQVGTMLFAGHDTTALTLTYALHLLGEHPDVRRRFEAEVDAVLGGDPPTLGDVSDLQVTERVVTETMRRYPPIHTIPRETTRPVEVDGHHLPADATIHLSLFRIHRDERFYDDPLAFRPGRWQATSPQEKGYAYCPFGAGPRICIGQRFARLEATLVLARLAQRYRVDPQESLTLAPQMTTQPDGEVPAVVRAR